MPDLQEVLSAHELAPLAWAAAHEAATFLRDERPDDLLIESKSTPTDPVSEMDRGAERRIIDRVLGARPDDAVLGEEGGERPGTSGIRWVVDPLDGTVNYLYRLPMWGVSIAAEVDGVAEVGVVIAPELHLASVAIRGGGAWSVNGNRAVRLAVSTCTSLDQALVSTGFNYDAGMRVAQGGVVHGLLGSIRDIRRSGSAVVDFSWVARGCTEAFYEAGLNRWDIAAGALIASEAGAVVRGLADVDPFGSVLVAAAPGIADALIAELRRCGADGQR